MNNKFKSNTNVEIDCLLPNGLLLTLNVVFDSSLNDILNEINKQVTHLYDESIINFNDLIITSVDSKSQIVEFYDLDKKLCDLNIFQEHIFLKLVTNETLDFNAKYKKSELSKSIK